MFQKFSAGKACTAFNGSAPDFLFAAIAVIDCQQVPPPSHSKLCRRMRQEKRLLHKQERALMRRSH